MAGEFNAMVGGEAGQGVQSVGAILAKTFAGGGFSVFADQDYESRRDRFTRILCLNLKICLW